MQSISYLTSVIFDPCTCRDLGNLGLDGYLPPELLQIGTLKQLNLSNNLFHGPLPPQWASQSLTTLDLSNNVLSGPLPKNYGAEGVFPQLKYIFLHGNLLSGPLPTPQWTQGFAPGAVIILRPGNDGLCGPVPIVDLSMLINPPLSTPAPETMEFLTSVAEQSQYAAGPANDLSKVYIFYEGMMAPDSSVVITNTLGSCAEPCGRAFTVTTNLLDATWEYNVSLADIMANNPGLTPADAIPGAQLALPCYPEGVNGPSWFGSDSAVGMFAGGHQMGLDGIVGGELAGVVVGPNGLSNSPGIFYEGSRNSSGGSQPAIADGGVNPTPPPSDYTLPVYWFVKMDATFTVSAVSITAGNAMSGISLFVGTNATDYQSNTLVQRDLEFEAGETKVVPVDHLMGKLVLLNADGENTEGLSLANTKVWPAEGNAALNKPISTAGPTPLRANYSTDGSLSTCVNFEAEGSDSVWMGVDLGYEAAVSVVALTFGKDALAAASNVLVYVSSDDTLSSLTNATVCEPPYPETVIGKSHHVVVACGRKGRYVGVQILGETAVSLCELEVFLDAPPETPVNRVVAAKNVVGIAVGAALGGAALALLIVGVVVYYRRKKRKQKAALTNSMIKGSMHNSTINGFGSSLPSTPTGLGGLSDPDALVMEAGKAGTTRHDSITSGAGAPSGGFLRKWMGLGSNGSSENSGRSSPVTKNQIHGGGGGPNGGLDGMQPSTDLSKFDCNNCNIVDFKDIELIRTIGEGSFGLVWMARYLQTTVAVKILTHDLKRDVGTVGSDSALTQQPSTQVMAALQREASIMAGLRHPNCIQYLGATLNPPALIMEYCSKRSVDTILAGAVNDPKLAKQLDWVKLMSMACDAAKGMLYLHTRSPPIVHRDLKSPNLLVDGLWHIKVSDFNLSRALENNAVVSSLQITNPRWLAPEVLKGGQAGTAADVYSFGVVLWELLTWKLPWGHDTNPFSIINSVGGGARLPIPAESDLPAGPLRCFGPYVELMQHCWHPDPDARPTMDEVAQRLRGLLTEMVVNGRAESLAAAASAEAAAEKATEKADDASSSGGESR
jgi:Protein tyrosine and serine/threonine kinase